MHYLYQLSEDDSCIKRYPLRRLGNTMTVIKDTTHATAITDLFTKQNENAEDATASIPTLPDNAEQYFFSETETKAVLSPIRDCFSKLHSDVFPDQDPLVIRSIVTTLFSAGFIVSVRRTPSY